MASITHSEATDARTASNYRGELIGGALATLVLLAASQTKPTRAFPPCSVFCDNLGVVTHGNNPHRALPEKQVQMDILTLLRRNVTSNPQEVTFTHVYGHQDNHAAYSQLNLPQQLNVMADHLAKDTLIVAATSRRGRKPLYPTEAVRIMIGDQKSK
jgi:hypothetical protein